MQNFLPGETAMTTPTAGKGASAAGVSITKVALEKSELNKVTHESRFQSQNVEETKTMTSLCLCLPVVECLAFWPLLRTPWPQQSSHVNWLFEADAMQSNPKKPPTKMQPNAFFHSLLARGNDKGVKLMLRLLGLHSYSEPYGGCPRQW